MSLWDTHVRNVKNGGGGGGGGGGGSSVTEFFSEIRCPKDHLKILKRPAILAMTVSVCPKISRINP